MPRSSDAQKMERAMSSLPITDAFTTYLADERHFSPYTARCYGADLRQFVEFLMAQHKIEINRPSEQAAMDAAAAARANGTASPTVLNPKSITEIICAANTETVRGFLTHLGTQQYSAATMARKIATLRSFYKWADRRGLC